MNEESIHLEEVTTISEGLTDSLNKLASQLNTNPQPLVEADVVAMIHDSHIHLFIARQKEMDSIVGMITLVTFRTPYKMKGTLEDLVVDSSSRGQRLGEKLLQAAIDRAKLIGVGSLTLTSHPTRESANKLYQRLGFEKRDTNVYRIQL